MAAHDLFVVISYDIANDKRRNRVVKQLLDHGGQRVQWSVFECYLGAKHLEKLRERLRREMDAEEDSIRFYLLCANCRPKVEYMGRARAIDEPGLIII
jgi:CRISPR-associated protein Cas2